MMGIRLESGGIGLGQLKVCREGWMFKAVVALARSQVEYGWSRMESFFSSHGRGKICTSTLSS